MYGANLTGRAVDLVKVLADHSRLRHDAPVLELECWHGALRILLDKFGTAIFTGHHVDNVQLDLIFADTALCHVGVDQVRVRDPLRIAKTIATPYIRAARAVARWLRHCAQ